MRFKKTPIRFKNNSKTLEFTEFTRGFLLNDQKPFLEHPDKIAIIGKTLEYQPFCKNEEDFYFKDDFVKFTYLVAKLPENPEYRKSNWDNSPQPYGSVIEQSPVFYKSGGTPESVLDWLRTKKSQYKCQILVNLHSDHESALRVIARYPRCLMYSIFNNDPEFVKKCIEKNPLVIGWEKIEQTPELQIECCGRDPSAIKYCSNPSIELLKQCFNHDIGLFANNPNMLKNANAQVAALSLSTDNTKYIHPNHLTAKAKMALYYY
jgi:hypothetical protein